jgi:conjugal transfer ATP-binding protein TraC
MAYEIPSQLEYKEKIVFGLNFKQLLYVFIFGLMDFILFFRIPFSMSVRIILMIFPTFIAIGFMFFDLDKQVLNLYNWGRFRGTNDIKKFIGIKKVGRFIYTKKKIAVFRVTPINFGIKTKEGKETITRQFLRFMNAIDFPIQILMKTAEIDIDSYLDKLSSPIEYQELFQKNKTFLKKTLEGKQNREFYLIVAEKENIEIQVEICKKWLQSLNLKYSLLKKKELNALVETNSKELKNTSSYLQIDDQYHRTLYVHGYPRFVEKGFLDRIISAEGNFDFSLHIEPFPIETMIININKQLQKQKADLYSLNAKGITNPALEIQCRDTRSVLEDLQKGNDKLFNVSLYITCKAESLEKLNLLTKRIESTLHSQMILPKVALFRQDKGYKSVLPLAENNLKENRNITSKGLSAFFPFTSPFFETDEKGVWLGNNKNGIPIIKDIFALSNPNGVILAQSGGGKSFFAKLLISRYLLSGTKVMVIDPQGEYRNIINTFNGQRIDLSRTSKTIINPLDLMGHDYTEKRLALLDLMTVMLGHLTEPQRGLIDRALTITYEKKGITIDPETWNYKPPILENLLTSLISMSKDTTQIEKTSLHSLINRLTIYVNGVFGFLNRHTNIDFKNSFVCFDIGNIPKPVKPTIMFLVLDYVYGQMKKDLERKILLIDEAWSLLSRSKDASYIFEIVKTCRKYNMALLLINQEVEGLLTSPAGKAVLANSAYTVLLKQKPAVIYDVTKVFYLSKFEQNYLLSASVGEGILLIENEHLELKVVASDDEHKIITTKADEILEIKKEVDERSKQKDITINVDPKGNFFEKDKLSKEEIKFLLKKEFKERKYTSIDGIKRVYLVKPRFNEGYAHCLVTYDLYNWIKKHIGKVSLYATKKPDLVFEMNGKMWAIEVETGKIHNTKILKNKVKELNKNYGDNWFFVLTNRNFSKFYKKYGKCHRKGNIMKKLQKMTVADLVGTRPKP